MLNLNFYSAEAIAHGLPQDQGSLLSSCIHSSSQSQPWGHAVPEPPVEFPAGAEHLML